MLSTPPFCGVLPLLCQVGAHLADELARAIGAGCQRVGNLLRGVVAHAQLFFVDERVVDAIDHQLAQRGVFRTALHQVVGDPVAEAECFEEVLIDDVRAGRDHGIHHVVANQIDEDLFQAGADQRSGEAQDDAAILVAQHAFVDRGGAGEITRAVGHVLHGIDQRHHIVLLDIDVLDGLLEQFFLGSHSVQDINLRPAARSRAFMNFPRYRFDGQD